MLLPHLQEVYDKELDDLRVIEDISCADSFTNTFYAIPDGSYLFISEGREELRGEAYRIRDGQIEQVTEDGDVLEDL
jgi:dipeptidase E